MKVCWSVFILLFFAAPAFAGKSTFYVNKVYDYPQTELKKIIENYDKGGFCAPSAASNILKTFHAGKVDQGQMIKTLASPGYMNTDPNKGTTLFDFMKGLARYMNENFGGYKEIAYEGVGNYGTFDSGVDVPRLDWITDGIGMKSGTWLTINMFKHDPKTDEYTSVGGHLVTLVGYNTGARANILIVHDSASLKSEGASSEYLKVEPVESGNLVFGTTKVPAKGFLKITEGQDTQYATEEKYDAIIITGAIRLEKN